MVRRAREYKPEDDIRETPPDFFAALDAKRHFTIDACALPSNAKCDLYYSIDGLWSRTRPTPGDVRHERVWCEGDGLTGRFDGQRVWANPPFSQFDLWLPWAWRNSAAESITMIAPATRTDRPWWHQWVEPYRDDQPERRGGPTSPLPGNDGTGLWRLKTDYTEGRVDFLENGHPIYRKDKQGQTVLKKTGRNKGFPEASTAMFGLVILTWEHV